MGKVYLVGAGPGAPDLITVRGAELLKRADIVFFDALVHPDTVALAVNAKKVPVGKRCGAISTDQRFINRCLVEAAAHHECVVRLKGGDPMLFGRAQEEIECLKQANIPVEVVPGVTAAFGAGADLQISLTQRGIARSVTFATARVGNEQEASDWVQTVKNSGTVALYMSLGQAAEISELLQKAGMPADTPIAVVENASLPNSKQIRSNLRDLCHAAQWGLSGPALLFIGQAFRSEIIQTGETADLVDSSPSFPASA